MSKERFSFITLVCLLAFALALAGCDDGSIEDSDRSDGSTNTASGFYITGFSGGLAEVFILDFNPSVRSEIWRDDQVRGVLYDYAGLVTFMGPDSVKRWSLNGIYTIVLYNFEDNWKATNVQITNGNVSVAFSSFVILNP